MDPRDQLEMARGQHGQNRTVAEFNILNFAKKRPQEAGPGKRTVTNRCLPISIYEYTA